MADYSIMFYDWIGLFFSLYRVSSFCLNYFMNRNYQFGLLYLVHLLISADGEIDSSEHSALLKIKENEKISEETYNGFQEEMTNKSEKDIYNEGMDLLNLCTIPERLRAFSILYKLSEVDGRVHIKEVRLLLYSTRFAGIEFENVVEGSKKFGGYF